MQLFSPTGLPETSLKGRKAKGRGRLTEPWSVAVPRRLGRVSQPLYNVVLLDDNEHTYEYVIEMLMRLFAMPEAVALRHAIEVDQTGRTCVLTGELTQAERARQEILAQGRDPRLENSKGSMQVLLQPART